MELTLGTNRVTRSVLGPRLAAVLKVARRNPMGTVGALVLVAWMLVAITVPIWSPYNPYTQDIANRLAAPSAAHWFGTDLLGRDVFARVMYGARVSLPVAVIVLAIAMIIGGILGMISGFAGGLIDELIMRFTDIALAFPGLILALAIAAALGPSLTHASIAMVVIKWPQFARLMRGQVLAVKEYQHVEAARVVGAGRIRISLLHILPETISPSLVLGSIAFGNVILTIAGLSFLGLGAVPPTAEWGNMVADAQSAFGQWWIGSFPALAIVTVVLSANFLGDGLRDFLDPRYQSE